MTITLKDQFNPSNAITPRTSSEPCTEEEKAYCGGYDNVAELTAGQMRSIKRGLVRYPSMANAMVEECYNNDFDVIGGTLYFSN